MGSGDHRKTRDTGSLCHRKESEEQRSARNALPYVDPLAYSLTERTRCTQSLLPRLVGVLPDLQNVTMYEVQPEADRAMASRRSFLLSCFAV
eukprot:42373-Eustigmatos_ZCMA.PRE.1